WRYGAATAVFSPRASRPRCCGAQHRPDRRRPLRARRGRIRRRPGGDRQAVHLATDRALLAGRAAATAAAPRGPDRGGGGGPWRQGRPGGQEAERVIKSDYSRNRPTMNTASAISIAAAPTGEPLAMTMISPAMTPMLPTASRMRPVRMDHPPVSGWSG